LFFALWSEVWVGDILIVFRIVVAFGMTDEVHCARRHVEVVKGYGYGIEGKYSY
jgi:hypothetical protein